MVHLDGDGLHPFVRGGSRQNADACGVSAIRLCGECIDDGDGLGHGLMVEQMRPGKYKGHRVHGKLLLSEPICCYLLLVQSGDVSKAGRVSAKCRMSSPKSVLAQANQARVKSSALSLWKDSCRKCVPAVVSRNVRRQVRIS